MIMSKNFLIKKLKIVVIYKKIAIMFYKYYLIAHTYICICAYRYFYGYIKPRRELEMLFRAAYFMPPFISSFMPNFSSLSRASILAILGLTLTACGGGGGGGTTPSGDGGGGPQRAPTLNIPTPTDQTENGIDSRFTIEVIATKRDSEGIRVSFPLSVTADREGDATLTCTATLSGETLTSGSIDGDNFVTLYSGNRVGSVASVIYNVVYPGQDGVCGEFSFTATEDDLPSQPATYSGPRFRASNQPPDVMTNRRASERHGVRLVNMILDNYFDIEVTAAKRDEQGGTDATVSVSFPSEIESASGDTVCMAELVQADGTADPNPIKTYPENRFGSNVTVTYRVTNPTNSDTDCGTFIFTATENSLGDTATLDLSFFLAHLPPQMTTNLRGPIVHDIDDDDFTIEVTATRSERDPKGTEVSFPPEVVALEDAAAGKGECTAELVHANGTLDTNPVKTYSDDSNSATVIYRVASPTFDSTCGDFIFYATEDGQTSQPRTLTEAATTATFSDLSFMRMHIAPDIVGNSDATPHTRTLVPFTINITATKRDDLGFGVSFPRRIVELNADANPAYTCIAVLDTATAANTGDDSARWFYPENKLGSKVTVTYSVAYPGTLRSHNCGALAFNATEDGQTSSSTLSGLRFIGMDEPPLITLDAPPNPTGVAVRHSASDGAFIIRVTATSQDNITTGDRDEISGIKEVTFPIEVASSNDGKCVARIDRDAVDSTRVRGGSSQDSTVTYLYKRVNSAIELTAPYSITSNNPSLTTECGDFTFNATEDGQTSLETDSSIFRHFNFVAPYTGPALITNPNIPVQRDTTDPSDFPIEVTARRPDTDPRAGGIAFPSEIDSTSGAITCRASLVKEGGTESGTDFIIAYPEDDSVSTTVIYNVANPGSSGVCGTFTFRATEDGQPDAIKTSTVIYDGLSFVSHAAPEVTTNPNSPVTHDRRFGNFTINVTATKRDILGGPGAIVAVAFPPMVTDDANSCTVVLDQTGFFNKGARIERAGQAANNLVAWDYENNLLDDDVTVTYTLMDPGPNIAQCGTFTFTATEDGQESTGNLAGAYNGLSLTYSHEPPVIATDAVPTTHEGTADFPIRITATRQDTEDAGIAFPLMVSGGVCTARLDTTDATSGNDGKGNATFAYDDGVRIVTYNVSPEADGTLCETFTFIAIEDGLPSQPITYSGLRFRFDGHMPPAVTVLVINPEPDEDADITTYRGTDDNVAINITATKQDPVGRRVSFPLNVTSVIDGRIIPGVNSAGGPVTCTAVLNTAGAVDEDDGNGNAVWEYPATSVGVSVPVTYNVLYPGEDTTCAFFSFNATEDDETGSAEYSGLGFASLAALDNDGNGLVDIRNIDDINRIRRQIERSGSQISDKLNNFVGSSDVYGSTGCPDTGCRGFELLNDIDLFATMNGSIVSWIPIGELPAPFDPNFNPNPSTNYIDGIFEGNGFTIRNLQLDFIRRLAPNGARAFNDNADIFGLFGAFAGEIRNLHLSNVTISGSNVTRVGALVGVYLDSREEGLDGRILDSSVTGNAIIGADDVLPSSFQDFVGVGGMVGISQTDLTMDNVSVELTSIEGSNVGGLIGGVASRNADTGGNIAADASLDIVNSNVSVGEIEANRDAGGLVGFFNSARDLEITRSTALINSIRSTNNDAGGIVGAIESANEVTIETTATVADSIQGGTNGAAGGVVGEVNDGVTPVAIQASTVLASDIDGSNAGGIIGLVGSDSRADVRASSAIVDTIGSNSSAGLIGYTLSPVGLHHSFAVNREIEGFNRYDELVGVAEGNTQTVTITSSYWQNGVSLTGGGATDSTIGGTGEDLATTDADNDVLYEQWVGVPGTPPIAGWCHPTTGEYTSGIDAGTTIARPTDNVAVWPRTDSVGNDDITITGLFALNCLSISRPQQKAAIARVQAQQSPLLEFTRGFRQ